MENVTTQQAIAEMIAAWTKIESAVRNQFQSASDEEVYQITKAAMNTSLKLA